MKGVSKNGSNRKTLVILDQLLCSENDIHRWEAFTKRGRRVKIAISRKYL